MVALPRRRSASASRLERRRRRASTGTGGAPRAAGACALDAGLAGTTSRFVTAVAALGRRAGHRRRRAAAAPPADGAAPRRAGRARRRRRRRRARRPPAGHRDAARCAAAARSTLPGDVSSQYLTALMLVGPLLEGGLRVAAHHAADLQAVRRVDVDGDGGVRRARRGSSVIASSSCPEGRYGAQHAVRGASSPTRRPPATRWAWRRWSKGAWEVMGLRPRRRRETAGFADLMGRMGCTVVDGPEGIGVGARPQRGAATESTSIWPKRPTWCRRWPPSRRPRRRSRRSRGIGFIRGKESDRLGGSRPPS